MSEPVQVRTNNQSQKAASAESESKPLL